MTLRTADRLTGALAVVTLVLTALVLTACEPPTGPSRRVVTCVPMMLGGFEIPGDSVCTWLDPVTGEGGPWPFHDGHRG